MATAEELTTRLEHLRAARARGTSELRLSDGRTVTYRSDAEMAAAIADLEAATRRGERAAGLHHPHLRNEGSRRMKNALADGAVLTLVAPYDVASGAGMLVGSIFGVAQYTATSGANVEAATEGVFDLVKVSAQAWTQGALIYWDNSAKNCTTTVGTNKLIGVAVAAAANPSSTGKVRLNGVFIG